ncbi:MAG: hypothetical protein WKF85_04155 [Chitinophagaceae bacterium]
MEERLKKLEARLFNIELLLLDLKYSINIPSKGRLIDVNRASEISGLNRNALYRTISKNSFPLYFFEDELIDCLKKADQVSISLSQNELING